jgi:hypothetical protein
MRNHFAHMLGRPLLAAAAIALVFGCATALAGSGVGGVFNLGQINTVNATSTLSGETTAPQLTVKNTSTNTSATALNLSVAAGRTPFRVNSTVKVANLNADLLDGRDSTYFLAKTAKAADADKLDGLDSTGFWKASGNAGTTPGTSFLGTTDNQALELKVNGVRAFRLEPDGTSPNVVGGYSGNAAQDGAHGATITGGGESGSENLVSDNFNTVGGGEDNRAGSVDGDPTDASDATVSGGAHNQAGDGATVGGGNGNAASGVESAVGGGSGNAAGAARATVAGGANNTAYDHASVGGGFGNTATGNVSTVAGGYVNTASGQYSSVPGGIANTASGDFSFAAGRQAKATGNGSFVWGDNTTTNLTSPAANTFIVRASEGIWLGTNSSPTDPGASSHFIDTSTGAYLSSAGAWTDNSDRALKHNLRRVNQESVLDRVARMPISSWSYNAEKPSVRHIGPMAQDFYSAFGLGLDDKHIATLDEGGVALAAIQGLYRQNQALKRQNRALNLRLARLERAVARVSR